MIQKTKEKIFLLSQSWGGKMGLDLPYFVKNGFWMTFRQFADLFIGIILSVVFARLATKEAFGTYQFVVATFALISALSIPGLNPSILRSVSRGYDGDYKRAVWLSFKWSLIGIPVILILGMYYYFNKGHALGLTLMLSSVLFPFFYAPNTWNHFLLGKLRFDKLTAFTIIQSSVNAIVTILAIYLSKSNGLVISICYLASYSALGCLFYFKSLRYISNDKKDADTIKYGWFLTKVNLLSYAADNLDKLMIGWLMSPVSLAVFSVVSMVPIKLKQVVKSILSVLIPKMTADNFSIIQELKKKKLISFILLTMVFFLGLVYYFSIVPVCNLLFGEKYREYYHHAKYFSILIVIYFPLLVLVWYTQTKKMAKIVAFVNFADFFIKVGLIFFFVKKWGILGGVWAYNINAVAVFILYLVCVISSECGKKSEVNKDREVFPSPDFDT